MGCVYSEKLSHILIGKCASTPAEGLWETKKKKTSDMRVELCPLWELASSHKEGSHERETMWRRERIRRLILTLLGWSGPHDLEEKSDWQFPTPSIKVRFLSFFRVS